MSLSVAITNWNRYIETKKAIECFLNDPRVDEIILSDDASTDGSFSKLTNDFRQYDHVYFSQHYRNVGMSRNKWAAVNKCKNKFTVLADSDNTFPKEYLDAFEKIENPSTDTIYCPSWAQPTFDYQQFGGVTFDKSNVKDFMLSPMFKCLLNTANYVVPTEKYVSVYKEREEIGAADTIWMNYLWLKAGHKFHVVPNMRYGHLQHEGSGFLQDARGNMERAKEIENLILAL